MNVPKLRFKGFEGEWEDCSFTDIVKRVSSSSDSNVLPKVEFEDIVAGEGRLNKDVSNKFDSRKGILFQPYDILYGKLRPYLKNWLFPDFEGIALGDFWVFRAINTAPYFIYILIQSERYQRAANDTTGTKMPRSDWKKVSTTKFYIPKSLQEQKKIGLFFEKLDRKIQLQQEKIDLLQKQKKGFLQKMFPKAGETQPELRFEGFTESWKLSKLSREALITMGQSPKSENYTNNPHDYILVQGNADMKNGWVVPRVWTTQVTKKADKGDLILSVRAPVGDVGKTSYPIVIGRGVASIKGNEFIFQQLIRMKVTGYWNRYSTGSTFESINSADIKNAKLFITNLKEQKKIGNFLERLDQKIQFQQQKLDILREQKEGFLQQMFV